MTDQPIEGAHAARSTLAGSPLPPIADYGFLSDCEVSALVAPSGNVEWLAPINAVIHLIREDERRSAGAAASPGPDPAAGAAPATAGEQPVRSPTAGPRDSASSSPTAVTTPSSRAHVVGEYSAETVQTVAAAMAAGMTVEQVAELQLAFPTFTEGVSMAAQKICRTIGIGRFPQVWSYLGSE